MCWLADNVFDWGGDFESCKKWNDSMLWRPLLRKTKWWRMSGEMIALTDVWGNHNKSRRFIASPRLIEPERAPIRERDARDPLHAIRSHQSDQSIGELGWGKPPSPILALLLLYKGGQHKTRARRRPRMERGVVGEWGGSWLPNSSDLLIWFCICIWQQTKAIVG